MNLTDLSFAFVLVVLLSVAERTDAQEDSQIPVTQEQLVSEIEASDERTLETLRGEIEQSRRETEAQISQDMLTPLQQRILRLEAQIDDEPKWWWPVVASVLLAAVVGFIFSRVGAHRDAVRVAKAKKLGLIDFKEFDESLREYLQTHTDEICNAKGRVKDIIESPLLDADSYLKCNQAAYRKEYDQGWAIRTAQLQLPAEGKQHTRKLDKLLKEHQGNLGELNRSLSDFHRLLQPLLGSAVDSEKSYTKYGVEYALDLVGSEAYQEDLVRRREVIDSAADKQKGLSDALSIELENIRRILAD